jgi:K319L-like, PKD domain/Peptidase family M23
VRTDAPTADTPVLAPIAGTIQFVETSGSFCIGIRDASGDTVMICHLNPASNIKRGMAVARGTQLATVAKAGDAANNGLSHIHLAVSAPGAGGRGMGITVPFVGQYTLEGVSMPATDAPDAYAGTTFTSTNAQNHPPTVDAGPDLLVRPGAAVALTAQGADRDGDALAYAWTQSLGPAVALKTSGPAATFTAPSTDGTQLRFTVTAVDPGGLLAYDSVGVTVSASAPEAGQASISTAGTILGGSLPPGGGFGTLLYGGGTTAQLVAASGCSASVRLWVVDGGRFIAYIPAAASFVNAEWNALFANGLPPRTIVIGSCS